MVSDAVGSGIRPLGGYLADKAGGVRLLRWLLLAIAGVYAVASTLPPLPIMVVVLVAGMGRPDRDGYAIVARLRDHDRKNGRTTPAIALTAYGRAHDRVVALTAGYNMHVPKPVDPGELTAIIASVAARSPEA